MRASEFMSYSKGFRSRTDRLVPLIPPALFDWRPQEEAFSFGDLLRHVAGIERWMWAENAAGRPARYRGHAAEVAEGKDPVQYFGTLRSESSAIFENLTDDDLESKVATPAGVEIRLWKWLRAMLEHEAHHRGQLYLMLRMNGIATPPLFGLTSEQVRDRRHA
jgi:uncharacterized damage-inducible protein DinB